ncbi:putative galactinol--sucrose galactosyltransferase 5 [Dorcoceras hygrometricum]|uniref:Putative galactinol--sucrose galactosyltransferase 5 n=1 Tax=Dorcoceras hygrometricum TaxID=472368 RepID=A0A2Z7C4F9_9LAMI|nr:putative galactinol--sucrose galactosyltransferase 5 [Dorcoceras hygrometricum]
MASSLISNSHHIDFDAVFGMEDTDLVQMFESLIATRLKNFLGCPAVFNEDALTEFFASSVREDGLVVRTVNGVSVDISEEVFVETFELPVEGLTYLSDVPKNLVFDARSLFSISKEQILLMTAITFDVKINWSSLLFGVLREMVTPGSRQAKGYAIQICVLLGNVPGLELGESKTFLVHIVLNERTVHRYVVINDKLGGEEVVDAPKIKRTPTKNKGVTKKRQAAGDAEVAPIVKKKRTTKGKPVAAKRLPVEEPVGVSTTSEQPVAEVATGQ